MTHDAKAHRLEMRTSICAALLQLMEEKPYENIEVGDICEKAFISRQTFYRYFLNKDNIMRWKTKGVFKNGVCKIGRTLTWREGYYLTILGFRESHAFFTKEQPPAFMLDFVEFGGQLQRESIVDVLTQCKGIPVDDKLRFQIEALDAAQAHMMRRWCRNGMDINPKDLSECFTSIVPYDLFHLLNDIEQSSACSAKLQ